MAVTGFARGWPIEYTGTEWVYMDTRQPIDDDRPCKRCGRPPTPEGHDACLGTLEGVSSACCGHGVTDSILVADCMGVADQAEQVPSGIWPQSQISDAIERAIKRVAAMNPAYRNILTQSASPTVRIPRKPVHND